MMNIIGISSPSYLEDLWFIVVVVQYTIQAFVCQIELWKKREMVDLNYKTFSKLQHNL